ncbi:MULE transposase domain-containing protein [Phthorimaea operculella]|nr:MULE transposase domain-containing protein [Phthorimaea operculella]
MKEKQNINDPLVAEYLKSSIPISRFAKMSFIISVRTKTNNDGSSLWRCANRNICSASLKLNSEKVVLKISDHVCKANYAKNKTSIIVDKCKEAACQTFGSVPKIIENVVLNEDMNEMKEDNEDETDEEINFAALFKSKKDSIYRTRNKFLEISKSNCCSVSEVQVPNIIAHNFLVCNDGSDDKKILIFSSPLAQKTLKKLKDNDLYGDGTFKSVPLFYQLYTIHINLNTGNNDTVNIVPAIFCLLPDKTLETYIRVFQLIKNHFHIEFTKFKTDYEVAQIQALKFVFPGIVITGCYYHFSRAIWKNAEKLDILNTTEGRKITNLCANLPLVPKNYIPEVWQNIKQLQPDQRSEAMIKFEKYIEKQWMGKLHEIISCASETHRTNNSLEGRYTPGAYASRARHHARRDDAKREIGILLLGTQRLKGCIVWDCMRGFTLLALRRRALPLTVNLTATLTVTLAVNLTATLTVTLAVTLINKGALTVTLTKLLSNSENREYQKRKKLELCMQLRSPRNRPLALRSQYASVDARGVLVHLYNFHLSIHTLLYPSPSLAICQQKCPAMLNILFLEAIGHMYISCTYLSWAIFGTPDGLHQFSWAFGGAPGGPHKVLQTFDLCLPAGAFHDAKQFLLWCHKCISHCLAGLVVVLLVVHIRGLNSIEGHLTGLCQSISINPTFKDYRSLHSGRNTKQHYDAATKFAFLCASTWEKKWIALVISYSQRQATWLRLYRTLSSSWSPKIPDD